MYIPRHAEPTIQTMLKGFPVVVLTGPRQSGKSTLAMRVFAHKPYVSLEDPDEDAFAKNDPRGFLGQFPDGAVLDEIQRCPQLLSYLQGIVDQDGRMGLFLLTGSQQFGVPEESASLLTWLPLPTTAGYPRIRPRPGLPYWRRATLFIC